MIFSKRQGNDPQITFRVEVKEAYIPAQKDRWRWESRGNVDPSLESVTNSDHRSSEKKRCTLKTASMKRLHLKKPLRNH
jgi:hypothetical protein